MKTVVGDTSESHLRSSYAESVAGSGADDPLVPWKPRPVLGSVKTLVLLIQFSDVRLRSSISKTRSTVELVNSWFKVSSYGKMQFDYSIYEDVLTLPRIMSYYGAPERGSQRGDATDRKTLYIENTLSLVWQKTKIDFRNYKNIVIIHAGGDEAASQNPNDIWSSCYGLGPVSDEVKAILVRARDGTTHSVWGISTFSEDEPSSVWTHELAHSLGITDLYVYGQDGYSENSGVGFWSLMDSGSWLDPPSDIDGWNKYILGWIDPVVLASPKGESLLYTLDSDKNPKSLLIKIENNDNEYYFVHARRKAGTDVSLPSEGVVVFRINRMFSMSYGGSELALVIDANPDTPQQCGLYTGILSDNCQTVDAPYNKGKTYTFRRGQLAVNAILENDVFWDDKARIVFKVEPSGEGVFRLKIGRSPSEIGVEKARPITLRRIKPQQRVTTTRATTVTMECMIASAAYGSALAPEVQFLRDFRDQSVRSTFAGSEFMKAFNRFYYSFSPAVASAVAQNPTLSSIVRLFIYPLLSILRTVSIAFHLLASWPELGVVVSGILASALLGITYTTPLLVVVVMRRKRSLRALRFLAWNTGAQAD